MKKYELNVQGEAEMDLYVEMVDETWNLARVLEAVREGTAEGFDPLSQFPSERGDWKGEWSVGGKVIARYQIGSADYWGEIDGGYDEEDHEVDAAGNAIES